MKEQPLAKSKHRNTSNVTKSEIAKKTHTYCQEQFYQTIS